MFQRPVEAWDEYVYVCQKSGCTRFFVPWMREAYSYEQQTRWLVAPRRGQEQVIVVRCPQHITESALRQTVGYNKETREWAERAKLSDLPDNEAWSPLTPYPLDPRLLFGSDGRLAVSLSGRTSKYLKDAKKNIA